jgi:hypothetical protein
MFNLSRSKHLNLAKIYDEASDLFNSLPVVRRKRRRRHVLSLLKYSFLSAVGVLIVIIAIGASQILALNDIYNLAASGKNHLEQAAGDATAQNFQEALILSDQAGQEFASAGERVLDIESGWIGEKLTIFNSQLQDLRYLLSTAEVLSRAVRQGSAFGQELQNLTDNKRLTYGSLSADEKNRVLGRIYESAPELSGIKANLELSLVYLNRVNFNGILLWPIRGKILELKSRVEYAAGLLDESIPLARLIPPLIGYPRTAAYLVLLENSDELRATGGFLGTYGILEIKNGEILRFDTHDIYHIDMPVKDKIKEEPPAPIKKYLNDRWYMRDSNWSPDWPTAAQKIEWFYAKEDALLPPIDQINDFKGKFDGVIAITPELITDLLVLTGPITVSGEVYDENNFVDLLQYKVEKGYVQLGIPSWHRKEIIGDIAKELKIRLFDLPTESWQDALAILSNNLKKKNFLIYLKDGDLAAAAQAQKWTGEMLPSDGDYVMVVDSNMGALKTDAVMAKAWNYTVEERQGGLFSTLDMNYAHQGTPDWKTGIYRSYTRIYLPKGSQISEFEGFEPGSTETGYEFEKSFIAGYLIVEPGATKKIRVSYRLPDNLSRSARNMSYDLLFQKQPGAKVESLKIDVSLANRIKSYEPIGFSAAKASDRRIIWETDLTTDKSFSIR